MNQQQGYCSIFNLDASETISYNNPLFPAYVGYGFLSCYPNYSGISHWHPDLEFILITKGKMTYNVNGELVALSEKNGIMVNSRQLHYGFSPEHEECEFICVLLSPELLQGNQWFYRNYVERLTNNTAFPYLYLSRDGWQGDILDNINQLYASFCKDGGDTLLKDTLYFETLEAFCAVMKILYENLPRTQSVSKKESSDLLCLKNMISYIEGSFTERITLEDISLAGACCKSKCSLLFKKYLRDTPISYLTKYRLRKSLVPLSEPDSCITDIAYEYGFGGASYYCETFRKYYGMSPLKYKKEQLEK